MFHALPPFALAPARFRFPALAALSARLALGAGRETALAILVVARVAEGVVSPPLSRAARQPRATAAAQWLTVSCPDARVRAACLAVVEATAEDAREPIARALGRLMELNTAVLDGASRSELSSLVRDITG